MPNIQLLVRPNPGGLLDHRNFITQQAKTFMTESSFSDLVLTSEDGHSIQCHQSLIVPRSSLLQSICYNVPQHPGTSLSLQITVPIRKEILVTIQELLYTGQVHRTKKEIEEVSNGLALLGINDFSGPPQFIHPGITAIPLPPNTVATKQSSGSQTPEFLKSVFTRSNPVPPGPSPTINTSAKFVKLKDVTHSNNLGLLIQKVVPSPLSCKKEVNETNNNEEEEVPDGGRSKRLRKRRKKTIYSDAGNLSDSEEIELDGTPITEEIRSKKKERCGKMMSSRHDYQVVVRCPECDTPLRSTWYLPPSRHNCTAATNHNVSIDTVKDTQEEDQRSRKSRRLSLGSELISPSPLVANPSDFETPTRPPVNDDPPNQFSCPLKGCFRKCDTKKDLMLHLAFTHYQEKLVSKYIIEQPIGENSKRECLHCNIPQTGCKHGYIKHIAHEHQNVVEELAAESIYGDIQEEERKKIEPNNELHDQDLD